MRTILTESIIILQKTSIISYEIVSISLVLNTSATVYLLLFSNDNKIYERVLSLNGDEYLAYTDDSYLYTYINSRIEKIYNN